VPRCKTLTRVACNGVGVSVSVSVSVSLSLSVCVCVVSCRVCAGARMRVLGRAGPRNYTAREIHKIASV
jgi:hypothetical protein